MNFYLKIEKKLKYIYFLPDRALLLRMCCVLSFNGAIESPSFFDLLVNVLHKSRMCRTKGYEQHEEDAAKLLILHGGDLYCK